MTDEFRERSARLVLATINALLTTAGMAMLVVGVFRGLCATPTFFQRKPH